MQKKDNVRSQAALQSRERERAVSEDGALTEHRYIEGERDCDREAGRITDENGREAGSVR